MKTRFKPIKMVANIPSLKVDVRYGHRGFAKLP